LNGDEAQRRMNTQAIVIHQGSSPSLKRNLKKIRKEREILIKPLKVILSQAEIRN
jgi:hypothetical protein